MTIAIGIKVKEGIVLLNDSALGIKMYIEKNDSEKNIVREIETVNIYSNANKLFQIATAFPIGLATYSSYNIGSDLLNTLFYEFDKLITSKNPEWSIDIENYSIENDIIPKFNKFISRKYNTAYKDQAEKPLVGLILAGYSSHRIYPEIWKITLDSNGFIPNEWYKETAGLVYDGSGSEALERLIYGISLQTKYILTKYGDYQSVDANKTATLLATKSETQFIDHLTPLRDAIDIGQFLAQTAINFEKFRPTAIKAVGGPINIAIISRRGGFQWIKSNNLV